MSYHILIDRPIFRSAHLDVFCTPEKLYHMSARPNSYANQRYKAVLKERERKCYSFKMLTIYRCQIWCIKYLMIYHIQYIMYCIISYLGMCRFTCLRSSYRF